MSSLREEIFEDLKAQGRSDELLHPNASPYWDGEKNSIRYVCPCGLWFLTVKGLEQHQLGPRHDR